MYIYPSSPESASSLQSEESAAIKIQKSFRGYRVRKQLNRQNQHQPTTNGFLPLRFNLHRRQRRQQSSIMDHNTSSSTNINTHNVANTTNSETANGNVLNSSATNNTDATVEDRCATKIQAGVRGFLVRKKQKIATDAATKIQAGFRGFKARKETQKLKQK